MLKEILVSEVRVKILKLVLFHPNDSFHVRAIVRSVKAEINAVRRELDRLIKLNLLRKRQSSNRIYYAVNTSHPLYSDLVSMLAKEDGVGAEVIKNEKELGNISFAVLSKAFVRGRQSTELDVDLLIVGSVREAHLEQLIKREELALSKEINYAVMSLDEFTSRKRKNEPFIVKLLSQSRVMLVGDEEKFCAIV